MIYTYKFSEDTKEFLYKEEAFLDPLETKLKGENVYLLPASSTFVPCELEEQDKKAIVWNGESWEYVEDHRQKRDSGGVIIESSGTPFWMEGDTWESQPRYITELGPLPENAILEKPEKPEEVIKNELQQQYTNYIQNILDEEAKKLGYDSCLSVCSYVNTGVPKFDKEGEAFRAWRSAVWNKGYELLDLVLSGEMEIPTMEELIELLPKLEIIYE